MSWVDVENAIHTWVKEASGLADERVFWADQGAPRPAPPFVTVRIGDLIPVGAVDGVEVIDHSDDPETPGLGEELELVASGLREFRVSVQAFTPLTHSEDAARALLSRVQTKIAFSSFQTLFEDAGISCFDNGTVRNLSAILGTGFEGRAELDVRFYYEERVSERVGFIQSVEITNASIEPPETFIAGQPMPKADLELVSSGTDQTAQTVQVWEPTTLEAGVLYVVAVLNRKFGSGDPGAPAISLSPGGPGDFTYLTGSVFGSDDPGEFLSQHALHLLYFMPDGTTEAPGGLFIEFADLQRAAAWQIFRVGGLIPGNDGADAIAASSNGADAAAEDFDLFLAADAPFNQSGLWVYGLTRLDGDLEPGEDLVALGSQVNNVDGSMHAFWDPFPFDVGTGTATFNLADVGAVGLLMRPPAP